MIIRFNLAKFSFGVRFSLPPSLAYAYSYTSIPYSGISRVAVASYPRKRIWRRGRVISELKRFIHYLTTFYSQSETQLSISPIYCCMQTSNRRRRRRFRQTCFGRATLTLVTFFKAYSLLDFVSLLKQVTMPPPVDLRLEPSDTFVFDK